MLDLAQTLNITQTLLSPIQREEVITAMMEVLLQEVGGEKCGLIIEEAGELRVVAIAHSHATPPITLHTTSPQPLAHFSDLPLSLIEEAQKSQESILNTTPEGSAVYCMPLIHQNQCQGILYLESTQMEALEGKSGELLILIAQQSAIALTRTLSTPPQSSNDSDLLKRTQTQLMQSEKMSMLGHLVGGVTHEINNSVNFISGNLVYAKEYLEQLVEIVNAYQENYPDPAAEVEELIDEYDLEFLLEDLPKVLNSMQTGASRMQEVLIALRNFTQADESDLKEVKIHEILDNLVVILHNLLKPKGQELEIEVLKNYGELPVIQGYPGQLNQVFMNLFTNAIDALETVRLGQSDRKPVITIITERAEGNQIKIQFSDTGTGMTPETLPHIFEAFFTTKSSQQAKGLGLTLSQNIITKNHQGKIECTSQLDQGTTVMIQLPVKQ